MSSSLSSTTNIDVEVLLKDISNLPSINTIMIWIAIVPALYFFLVFLFRALNVLPEPVRKGSRGSDIMAFEIVAGVCVLYLCVAGIIGYFELFGVKPFPTNNLEDYYYTRSSYIENHLLTPMLSYQGWNLLLCLSNQDLYSTEMVLHHFFAAVSAIVGFFPYFQWFSLYFYGIVEFTNIPLTVVDVFKIFPQFQEKYPLINQFARYSFAISYFLIRLLLWPFYSYIFWGQSFDLLISGKARSPLTTVYILITHFLLTILQYFWGYKILTFVTKPPKSSDSTKSKVHAT